MLIYTSMMLTNSSDQMLKILEWNVLRRFSLQIYQFLARCHCVVELRTHRIGGKIDLI